MNHDKPSNNPGKDSFQPNNIDNFKVYDFQAPGAYEPEKVNLEHSPAFSFNSRINHDKPSETPGK